MITNYKEGDIWTEKGKTWTIKNGIKRTVTKMSETRKKLITPLACPKCSNSLSHWLDKKMYDFNGVCHKCTVEFEHELRKNGLYEKYERDRVHANAKGFVIDLESYIKDFINDSAGNNLITEDGDVESWTGNSSKRLEEMTEAEISRVKQSILTKT